MSQPIRPTSAAKLALKLSILLAATVSFSTALAQAPLSELLKMPLKFITLTSQWWGIQRVIIDRDGDGWDDTWRIISGIKHSDKTRDTDGDLVSDYEEMILNRDPIVKGPLPPRPLTATELAEGQRRAAERAAAQQVLWEQKLAEAAPYMRQLLPPGQAEPDAKLIEEQDRAAKLQGEAAISRLLQPGKERALDDVARKYGVEKEFRDESGKKLKLSGDSLGPVYIQGHDTLSAAGVSADELWPTVWWWPYSESNTGLNLTGSGQTLGMWEVDGGVRTSHIEMGTSRITQKDSAALDVSGHATNVAGTMAASGSGSLFGYFYESRGVAFEANVFAYEQRSSFKSEREGAAAGNATDPPLRLANHSWGATNGWRLEDIDTSSGTNYQWVWYGPQQASFQEDHKFGFYMPDLGDDSGGTQIDLFLQSQAPQHLMVYSCGNDRAEGPGASPGTYYYRTGTSTWIPVSASAFPRDWDDGDAGYYDTVAPPGTAKNVLTVGACEDVYFTSGSTTLGYGPGANAVPAAFSGAGPTDDGRIKPDLVAVGTTNFPIRQAFALTSGSTAYLPAPHSGADGQYNLLAIGTSFAAPAVTGALGLVQQRRAQLYPSLPASQAWRGSTLKAIAINTCDDAGSEGPDYHLGYGILNAKKAVLAVNADHANGRGSLIKELSLAVSQSMSWVVVSDGTQPLAVTAPWSDPPGPALTSITAPDPQNAMLVNDIELKVEYLGADLVTYPPPATPVTTYYPWVLNPDLTIKSATTRGQAATRGADHRNNVEKVSIVAPAAGRYRITVAHAGGLSGNPAPSTQVVSVALSGVAPEAPRITELAISPTANEYLIHFTADPGAYFTVQTSTDLMTWTDVGSVLAEDVANAVVAAATSGETRRFWRLRRGQ